MKKTYSVTSQLKKVSAVFLGFLLCVFLLYGCASRKPKLRVSVYSFNFEGEVYRIWSISPGGKENPYNQLIGKNFVAVDFAQNRIIDHIIIGDVSRYEAQKIYEYGINMAIKENKLKERLPVVNRYIYETPDFYYEIRSFQPSETHPFNEFKIINKSQWSTQIIITVDREADGTLDEVLKGTVPLEEVQPKYSKVIKRGLEKRELVKVDNMILVRKR